MKTEFINALHTLKEWISKNEVIFETLQWKDSQQIVESEILKFIVQPISNAEIDEIKAFTQYLLPDSYYHFLAEIGSGQFLIGEYLPCFEIYNLKQLQEYNAHVQQEIEAAEINDHFIMIGSHCSMGDWMGFCTTRKDERNYDVFCHEYPIDEYTEVSDELNSWRTFEEWVIKAVETKGKETL
ncbi:SMI1/KNR4 family protein [Chryseobacterium capnotolerans]|uniref:SMI1/KNR4 family protein n=1 Tax=Chryseobacterium TaxID=59732 RepID=UPI00083B147F|nr:MULTISPECIES: SMI1/KNR4 family protein [Chryseobacterium]UHO38359.1 SMI1/KNR4 family protein [Chryseobacterium capnotolerans]